MITDLEDVFRPSSTPGLAPTWAQSWHQSLAMRQSLSVPSSFTAQKLTKPSGEAAVKSGFPKQRKHCSSKGKKNKKTNKTTLLPTPLKKNPTADNPIGLQLARAQSNSTKDRYESCLNCIEKHWKERARTWHTAGWHKEQSLYRKAGQHITEKNLKPTSIPQVNMCLLKSGSGFCCFKYT